ncbi:mitochondrial carrier protein [Colletotrichum truncatum]|uniref:Mitochondrial carrier protein n=1 Tax=Colletotrichum truncatum TaxID=5467 RepID=A0ACC3Z9J2_COLTU|nr:mitochondrial carrier protein [Colletotrichum truncatum]KAF6793657.1 mitochondrial carrier protein [Colletotrichum truncatum]
MGQMSKADILLWYRCLYRSALRAVQFSVPARYIVRDQLRAAFRSESEVLDKHVAQRTNWFLQSAAKERGLEHKILKNLVQAAKQRNQKKSWKTDYRKGIELQGKPLAQATKDFDATAHHHFDMTLAMLNKSMGLGLRCGPTSGKR